MNSFGAVYGLALCGLGLGALTSTRDLGRQWYECVCMDQNTASIRFLTEQNTLVVGGCGQERSKSFFGKGKRHACNRVWACTYGHR